MNIDILLRKLEREKRARQEAERILEEKSLELYDINLQLKRLVDNLELEVERRTLEIKKSEHNLFVMFEMHPFPMFVYDLENFTIYGVNQTAINKYGYSRGEFIQMKIYELHHSKDIPKFKKHIKNIDQANYTGKEWQHYTKDHICIDVEINGITIDYENRLARLIVVSDITDKKRIEAEKKRNEQKYQELVENVSDFIYRVSEDGIITYMNPVGIKVMGYAREEMLGKSFITFIRPDAVDAVKFFFKKQRDQNINSTYFEIPVLTKNKKVIWLGQTTDSNVLPSGKKEFIASARDITERKQIKDALQRSEEKYRNIMENMELGLLEVDVEGIITNAYPKFCKLSGYSKDELIGLNAEQTLLPANFTSQMKAQEEHRKNGQSGVYEVQLKRKDGTLIWVIISGAPYYDQEGKLAGTVGIHLDITDRKAVEQKLEDAIIVAKSSIKSKEQFMANMSHEIRTPMNAIIGMSALLQKSQLQEKQKHYVNAISTSADNLLMIVNDILDFSKIESGKLSLELIPCDISKVLRNTIKTIELKAEEKGLSLLSDFDIDHSFYLIDPTRLSQILINLLSNAVKFTSNGFVNIKCSVVETKSNVDRLKFEVSDSGIGIREDKLSTIFKSFIQAEESTTRKYGGTGLGLAISKQLVELMGGELTVESEFGKGSSFSFEVAVQRTESEEMEVGIKKLDPDLVRNLRVLLVEDNDINRFMAITILEAWGCDISTATNGQEAIDLLDRCTFDIVLMDVRMPVMDGIRATEFIRKERRNKVPIIALTANALKGDNESCLKAGMNDYISKPFQQEELLAVLIKYGRTDESPVQLELSEEETTSINESLIDLTKLSITTNNDQKFMQKMVELFVADTPEQIDAIELAVSDSNWDEVSRIAHKIKPSIDYVAVENLQNAVRQIEANPANYGPKRMTVFINQIRQLVAALSKR
ncbi:MAG: PAS domain S-box protein [Putridiphycobacter sp.]|nr:PAS domain S-box protein [Putridiphycobacter sp.]